MTREYTRIMKDTDPAPSIVRDWLVAHFWRIYEDRLSDSYLLDGARKSLSKPPGVRVPHDRFTIRIYDIYLFGPPEDRLAWERDGRPKKAAIRLEGVSLGNRRWELIAECRDPAAKPYFDELMEEIEKRWPEVVTATEGKATRKRGGRPRNADDDWAYQEIVGGRDQMALYHEWLERIPEDRRSSLVDPLDSFKKSMNYRKKQEKKE